MQMNQEMTDVPDNIRYTNAPSQNAIDEAYKKGYERGYIVAMNDVATLARREAVFWEEKLNKNHHHGDE